MSQNNQSPKFPTQTYELTIHYKKFYKTPFTVPELFPISKLGIKIFSYTSSLVEKFELTPKQK